jgi:hypothetical protein
MNKIHPCLSFRVEVSIFVPLNHAVPVGEIEMVRLANHQRYEPHEESYISKTLETPSSSLVCEHQLIKDLPSFGT